jgi:hypothetical protein
MLNTGSDSVNKTADFGEIPGLEKGTSYGEEPRPGHG